MNSTHFAQQEASDAAFALAFDEAQLRQLESSQYDVLDLYPNLPTAPLKKKKKKEINLMIPMNLAAQRDNYWNHWPQNRARSSRRVIS